MTDVASTENSYKNHQERCICAACAIVAIATEVAEIIDRLENEREHLRKERDEARREVCNLMHPTGFLRGDYAEERGWNCFEGEDK